MGCWWEGVDEPRVLIAPDFCAKADGSASLLSLGHPKSGVRTSYLFSNGLLQELHWFKPTYGSWFLGDYVSQDGSLYTCTPIDPVFIMLPLFEEARMKKADDPGKFRQLDEILFVNDYPGYHHLLSIAEICMQVVCEIKEIGSSKFFRLDDAKVLAWLYCKVDQLKEALPALDQNYATRNEKDTLADAVSIVGEYLKDEPWLKLLCDQFELNLPEATRMASNVEFQPTSTESPLASSNVSRGEGKNSSEKKAGKSVKQAKKAKVETKSRNIKEMFSRSLRK